ncbi:hypothetical protein HDV04_000650 [Boothiomyces sp. JEL0838]|nr:hypothetical protein HDV04_000650 [Boothiomyces sp. JEL0838]
MNSLILSFAAAASIDLNAFLASQPTSDVNLYNSMIPANQTLVYAGLTTGEQNTQNYDCTNGAYVLSGANATIEDGDVTHFFLGYGSLPTWSDIDGSLVTGLGKAAFSSPEGASNIKWLKVSPTKPSGNGTLSNIKTVLRTFTVGGQAPASCANGSITVPYQALYTFYA